MTQLNEATLYDLLLEVADPQQAEIYKMIVDKEEGRGCHEVAVSALTANGWRHTKQFIWAPPGEIEAAAVTTFDRMGARAEVSWWFEYGPTVTATPRHSGGFMAVEQHDEEAADWLLPMRRSHRRGA